ARAVLGIAAVAGRRVPYAVLLDVSAQPEEVVQQALEATSQARLLVEADGEAYEFPHDVLREVIEADLGAARRIALHRRVAEARPLLEHAAEAYRVAGDHAKLVGVTAWMGRAHALRGTPQEGIALITALLERLDRGGTEASPAALHEALAVLLFTAGRYDESL